MNEYYTNELMLTTEEQADLEQTSYEELDYMLNHLEEFDYETV